MVSNKIKTFNKKKDEIEGYLFLAFIIVCVLLIFYFLPSNVTL